MDPYAGLKTLHVGCAALSLGGFVLRGTWMLRSSPLLHHRLTRILPHLNDSVLLGAGIGLALLIGQYPLTHAWLTAKLLALLAYIVLGSIALKRGRTRRLRGLAFGAALLAFAYMLAVTLTHRPWPPGWARPLGRRRIAGMERMHHRIAFGPVPSRRLGRSLGINNIPTKACSYTCIYCQIGPTTRKLVEPRAFFPPQEILAAVTAQVTQVRRAGGSIDYLSFVPDGEPTLDARLGEAIAALRTLGIPIAVISNATLLWREEVRARLAQADLVSVKVDSVVESIWRQINLPHRDLSLAQILDGIRRFAAEYRGELISDTMLVAGVNDGAESLTATADFLAEIAPRTAYLAVPTRPTTVHALAAPDEAALVRAYAIFAARLPRVELLLGHETEAFAHTGDAREDLLAITAVHPMREGAVRRLLADDGADWGLVETLVREGTLKAVDHAGERFYLRPVRRTAAEA